MFNDPREPDETLPRSDDGGGEPADHAAPKPGKAAPQQPVCPSQIGRYRVERLLGKGGFGTVYLAHDDQLQRHVAIKVPHRELTSQPADAEAYLDEARVLAHLDHSHIVPVHDVGSTPEFPCFFVSKYIDGTSLDRRMEQAALTYAEAAELTARRNMPSARSRAMPVGSSWFTPSIVARLDQLPATSGRWGPRTGRG